MKTSSDLCSTSASRTSMLCSVHSDGKGLVKDTVFKGVRGVLGAHQQSPFRIFSSNLVCKTVVRSSSLPTLILLRHVAQQSDFELESPCTRGCPYQHIPTPPISVRIPFQVSVPMLVPCYPGSGLFYDLTKAEGVIGQSSNSWSAEYWEERTNRMLVVGSTMVSTLSIHVSPITTTDSGPDSGLMASTSTICNR